MTPPARSSWCAPNRPALALCGADGSEITDRYRLITTLLDHHRHPATELIRLYHERWEIEIAYLALRHTMLDGHRLRSGDRLGLEQEVWALLTLYQLLRMTMVTAVESHPRTDPDRASFTTALQTARDQLTSATDIYPDDPSDLVGLIGRAVLNSLLPKRRLRYSARTVKNATSRYRGSDYVNDRPKTPPRSRPSRSPCTPCHRSPALAANEAVAQRRVRPAGSKSPRS